MALMKIYRTKISKIYIAVKITRSKFGEELAKNRYLDRISIQEVILDSRSNLIFLLLQNNESLEILNLFCKIVISVV